MRSGPGSLLRFSLIVAVLGAIAAVVTRRRSTAADRPTGSGAAPSWPAFDPTVSGAAATMSATAATMSATAVTRPVNDPTWTDPCDGRCPDTHPIKAKTSSGIYHRPGGRSYERTTPDRCYRLESDAEADGFRAARV